MADYNLVEMLRGVTIRTMTEEEREGFAGADDDALIGENEKYLIVVGDSGFSVFSTHKDDPSQDLMTERLFQVEEIV